MPDFFEIGQKYMNAPYIYSTLCDKHKDKVSDSDTPFCYRTP